MRRGLKSWSDQRLHRPSAPASGEGPVCRLIGARRSWQLDGRRPAWHRPHADSRRCVRQCVGSAVSRICWPLTQACGIRIVGASGFRPQATSQISCSAANGQLNDETDDSETQGHPDSNKRRHGVAQCPVSTPISIHSPVKENVAI